MTGRRFLATGSAAGSEKTSRAGCSSKCSSRLFLRYHRGSTVESDSGASTTVLDMANFAIMHLERGLFHDQQILNSDSVALMHSAHTTFRKPAGEGYGLTFMIEQYKGVRLVGHSGSIPYFHSRFYLVPDVGVAVIALANCMAGFQRNINIVLDQLLLSRA